MDRVIISVNAVADHLEKNEGRGDDSRVLREFFTREPVKQAIEAVHRLKQVATTLIRTAIDVDTFK